MKLCLITDKGLTPWQPKIPHEAHPLYSQITPQVTSQHTEPKGRFLLSF